MTKYQTDMKEKKAGPQPSPKSSLTQPDPRRGWRVCKVVVTNIHSKILNSDPEIVSLQTALNDNLKIRSRSRPPQITMRVTTTSKMSIWLTYTYERWWWWWWWW